MIGSFPQPHPDELFYSICARFSDRMGYPSADASIRDLFGTHYVKPTIALPSHLGRLISLLPPGNSYTVDDLIDKHTLLPFYGPFLPPERLQKVRNAMSGDSGKATILVGIVSWSVPLQMWLRFCPLCVNEDIKLLGECYWHRVHQVSGVEVCPIHEVFLQNSDIRLRNATLPTFASAQSSIRKSEIQRLDLSSHSHNILLAIAHDVSWLLGQRGLCEDRELLIKRYASVLADRGFPSSRRGKLDTRELLEAFRTYYSLDLLKLLHCGLQEKGPTSWISYLMNPRNPRRREQHPLHHLLLMHFLGYTVEEFFERTVRNEFTTFDAAGNLSHSASFESVFPTKTPPNSCSSGAFSSRVPFGEGPWPCLNPVSEHYNEAWIQQCFVIYNSKETGKLIGMFSCDCGFAYYRKGPDLTIEDRFRKSRIKSYGPAWESALRRLWDDSEISLKGVARQLGVSSGTIKRQAFRLGLLATRGKMKPLKEAQIIPSRAAKASTRLEVYRATWQTVLKENPEASRQALRCKTVKTYCWLYKHDREWLKAHLPKKRNKSSIIDWNKRDAEFFEVVKASAVRIKNAPGRPKWVNNASIRRDTGLPLSNRQILTKLPLTSRLLEEVVETAETFAVRRILWVAEQYKQENTYPTWSKFVRRSGLSEQMLKKSAQVNLALDSALETLRPSRDSISRGAG